MIPFCYEDKYLVVCIKPVGVLSERDGTAKNMPDLIKKQTGVYRVDTVHRLDRNVGGLMVYSKSGKATPPLVKMMANHSFVKEYLAVIKGVLPQKSGTFTDYLYKDKKNCKVFVSRVQTPETKLAVADYTVIAEHKGLSLVSVRLMTGRTHQIRVQFASRGFPLIGDTKYGAQDTKDDGKTPISLWSYHLSFPHPVYKKIVDCYAFPKKNGAFSSFAKDTAFLAKKCGGERGILIENSLRV